VVLYTFARRVLWPALRKCRKEIVAALVLLVLTTASTVATVEVARATLTAVKLKFGVGVRDGLLVWLPAKSSESLLIWCTVLALTLPTLTWVGVYFRDVAFERIALSVIRSLRNTLFDHLIRLPYSRLIEMDPGILAKRLIDDTGQVRALVIEAGLRRFSDAAMVLGILIYLYSLNRLFAALSALAIGLFFIVAYWSAGLARGRLRERDASRDQVAAKATEAFSRLIDIRCAAKENFELRRFSSVTAHDESISARCVRWLLLDRSITGYLRALGPMVVLLVGGWTAMRGGISVELLVIVVAATSILYGPVDALSAVPITLRQVEIAAANLMTLFEEPLEHDGLVHAHELAQIGTRQALDEPFDSMLSICGLVHHYDGSAQRLEVPALKIYPGAHVALIGESGTGKSTLMRLLFGMLHNFDGTIKLYGRDIRSIAPDALRARIAFLHQDNALFSGSVRDNVAYGAHEPEAATDAEVRSALVLAGIAEDVARMPEDIHTRLETLGQNLSTGQRRRLCLARALMRRPEVLLLDEPVAGVSPAERLAIHRALLALSRQIAVVMTTHDYEMLDGMDFLVILRRHRAGEEEIVVAEVDELSGRSQPADSRQ
jgi:ABC-type bacteriocin/lantibiotic exporter with double-glycine peptidase domain